MDNFDLKKYLAEGRLYEENSSERKIIVKKIGRDTGVKFNLKKITKILKKAGYPADIEREGILPSNMDFVKTASDNLKKQDYGYIEIYRNGEIHGSDNWGTEISSEDEVIPALEKFLQDQESLYKEREEKERKEKKEGEWRGGRWYPK
jgi:uncharacterized Rmd1/YagE family protein